MTGPGDAGATSSPRPHARLLTGVGTARLRPGAAILPGSQAAEEETRVPGHHGPEEVIPNTERHRILGGQGTEELYSQVTTAKTHCGSRSLASRRRCLPGVQGALRPDRAGEGREQRRPRGSQHPRRGGCAHAAWALRHRPVRQGPTRGASAPSQGRSESSSARGSPSSPSCAAASGSNSYASATSAESLVSSF